MSHEGNTESESEWGSAVTKAGSGAFHGTEENQKVIYDGMCWHKSLAKDLCINTPKVTEKNELLVLMTIFPSVIGIGN